MKWMQAVIDTNGLGTENLCAALSDIGIDGVITEDEAEFREFLENNKNLWDYVDDELENKMRGVSRIRFYLPDNNEGRKTLARVRSRLGISPEISPADDGDWENNWRDFFKPSETGERLIIVPEWETAPPSGRTELRIDPGLLFGTGTHATTRLCLSAVEKYAVPGVRALDIGCGSGILAIAALVLGCDEAVCCDIDPAAITVVTRNAELNDTAKGKIRVLSGDILTDAGMRKAAGTGYKLITANITSDVIIPLCETVGSFTGKDAVFICSGIIDGRDCDVSGALLSAGFSIIEHTSAEDWHCFTAAVSRIP
ncbi:MAG: 50S ribosomal protein L11 methyltransferase [Oscillospiraceae bacterium]|nr:50S ribosomal protein L11 methyltransferase [Oscillospiraceae bacterium]